MTTPRVVLTSGEPSGIGPDLCLAVAGRDHGFDLVVAGDPDVLRERATVLGIGVAQGYATLGRIGYRGAVVVEVMAPGPDPFRAIKDDRSALMLDDYLRESLACLRRTLP